MDEKELKGELIEMQNFILTLKSTLDSEVMYPASYVEKILNWADSAITLINKKAELQIQNLSDEIQNIKKELER